MTEIIKREVLPSKITEKQAMYLLRTVWPKAPQAEVVKAAIICYQYGLNPLLKQIFLIPYKKKEGGETWSIVIGINATRLIAQKKGRHYSYIDGPRIMTDEEVKMIFGKIDPERWWAITKIKDELGNEYPGYGFWLVGSTVYGADKGNSPVNMAFIRSERNAEDTE